MSLLQEQLYSSFQTHKNLEALSTQGKTYTYQNILDYAAALNLGMNHNTQESVSILGDRSLTAYAGVACCLFSGKTFVPINPSFAPKQNQTVLDLSGCKTLIFDLKSWKTVKAVIADIETPLLLITLDAENDSNQKTSEIRDFLNQTEHSLYVASIGGNDAYTISNVPDPHLLYVLFTSGTTGVPKGVPISHNNVEHYLSGLNELLDLSSDDRFSQTFDLTFDLSMHCLLYTSDAADE